MGRVIAPYGVKGWLKVAPLSAERETLLSHAQWWLRPRGERSEWRQVALLEGRPHGSTLIVRIEGLEDREAAAALSGGEIGVPRRALPPARKNEVYLADLVGLAVRNRQGETLGTVGAVQEFGAHPVLRVEHDEGAPRLIPFVEAYVDAVDLEARRIDVDWGKDY
ncbi:MAG: ribosome maturation factor RimM [Burkholderiales bacterium]